MSSYEFASIAIATLSMVVAIVALVSAHSTGKKQLMLQEATDKLAQKQLERLEADQARANNADLQARFEGSGHNHRLVIENVGGSKATDVRLQIRPRGDGSSPVLEDDYVRKFPCDIVSGQAVGVLASFTLSSARSVEVVMTWLNPDGSSAEVKQTATA